MMALPALFLLAFLLGTPELSAQDEDTTEFDDFDFDEIPVDDFEADYVGFGLGYLGNYGLLPLDEASSLATSLGMPEFGSGLLSHRLGLFIGGIGLPNLRYGFYFPMGGSKEVTGDTTILNTEYERKVVFSSNRLSFQVDYAIPLPADGLVFFPGLMVSSEQSELELYQTRKDDLTYDILFDPDEYNGSQSANAEPINYGRIQRSSIQLQPTLTIDYAVNYFLLLRAGAGYGFNVSGEWEHSSGIPVSGAPDIQSDGMQIQFGLFVGLFQK